MNAAVHTQISVAKRGGKAEDYYPIHAFIDSTKELCSDNRHRVLHNLWGIRRVIIPIFGHTLINSDGKSINTKDLCEQDHILPDYNNRFIPTLADFVEAMPPLTASETTQINTTYSCFNTHPEIQQLLISPLNITGELKALRITHNTWFCNEIIPRIFETSPQLKDLGKVTIFEQMRFKLWMDNGNAYPPSTAQTISI